MPISYGPLESTILKGTAEGGLIVSGAASALMAYADGGLLVIGDALGTSAINEPIYQPAIADGGVQLAGEAIGAGSLYGFVDSALFIVGDATAGAFADGSVYLGGSANEGSTDDPGAVNAFAIAPDVSVVSYVERQFGFVDELLGLGSNASRVYQAVLHELLAIGAGQRAVFVGSKGTSERLGLGDRVSWVLRLLASEGIVFGTSANTSFTQLARVVSRMLLGGHARNLAEALAAIVDGLTFAAATDALRKVDVTETMQLGDTVRRLHLAIGRAIEQLMLSAQGAGQQLAVALVSERLQLGDEIRHEADLAALVRESIGFLCTFSIDNGEYIAWVLNAQSKGLTRYTNYPFNSFARIAGKYYGAASDGIYLLEGDDDTGLPIEAKLRLGLSSMGNRKLKRMPEAFIAYTSSGDLLLRVITVNEKDGEKEAAIYRLRSRGAINVRENRFEMGRGLKAVDWDFVLENVDGADFELASLEFHALVLDRRTRG